MHIGITLFFFFAAYGASNVTLPLVLRGLGYSVFNTGILMSVFEIAGIAGPLLVNARIEKTGKYGLGFLFMALIMLALPYPLLGIHGWTFTAFFLAIYAVSLRGSVPLADSITTKLLGDRLNSYGTFRCLGSAGYVVMVLIIQFCTNFSQETPLRQMLWLSLPVVPLLAALFILPDFLHTRTEPVAEPKKKTLGLAGTFSGFPRTYWSGIILIFLGFLALAPANRLLPLYVEEYLGIHASAGLYAVGAAMEIPAFLFSRHIFRYIRGLPLLRICTAAITVRMLLYVLFPSLAGTLAAQLMHFMTYGLLHPAAILFVTENAPRGKNLASLSIYQILAGGMANILGSAIGGAVIERFGYPTLFISSAFLPVLALLITIVMEKKK